MSLIDLPVFEDDQLKTGDQLDNESMDTIDMDRKKEQTFDSTFSAELNLLQKMGLPTEFGNNVDKRKRKARAKSLNQTTDYEKRRQYAIKLFSRFDQGIKLDNESWFSVTPEKIAKRIADRCVMNPSVSLILDPFCGAGGNVIQFALARPDLFILAIDILPNRIEITRQNAKIYGVEHRIEFLQGDYMQLVNTCRFPADVVFLSPPWGGPKYKRLKSFTLDQMPIDGGELFRQTKECVSPNICYFLPRNLSIENLQQQTQGYLELETNFFDKRLMAYTAYYGNLIKEEEEKEEEIEGLEA